ncbi:uncharacterized protein EDB93DRAFT_1095170 [Suillus bovinus]|uniref:uncharacterized protein n=1 Tax=Suillus bovinus TaxID=48563 RepID=UPI001B86FFC3|nr:uncharacterized protein EDB93DRAFT_1095170 [Suillus bovinus]KAG2129869.1 hypothetical protein EDB93DRAFT_1095170 [Suillus bovinus]
MLPRQPYRGPVRKLVLAFDVGTTYSAISYCILDPGEVPKIEPVTRYPAQEHSGGNSKIPSILYYDSNGIARAIGAEARQEHVIERAEDEGWMKLEWWKLHLRTRNLAANHITDDDVPPLPRGKNPVEVLGDFMQYLFRCARSYIEETHPSGSNLWRSLENRIEFVLTHPNGWEGPQQKQMRLAAVLGGLIPSTEEGMARVHLLTEGEASLHFCVANILASDAFSPSQSVVVIDAGGGTLDLSAYSMTLSPTLIEEIAAAECRLQGSVFVTRRAHGLIQGKLSGSRFGTPDLVQQMTDIFDSTAKLRFRNPEDPSYIKFGTVRDKDPQHDIRNGQLKLSGQVLQDVAKLFEPSISSIIEAFETQRKAAGTPITFVFFVGGFAASDWMFAKLQTYFQSLGISFSRPDNHCNKAVADGAVSYFIDHLVSSRVTRFTYGTECSVPFNPFDMEHRARQKQVFRSASGILALPRAFSSILTKGTRVSEQQEFSETFAIRRYNQAACNQIDVGIMSYKGLLPKPDWMDTERNTSKIAEKLTPKRSAEGSTYYAMEIKVILLFGLTELKAGISWEDGVSHQFPGSIASLICAFPAQEHVGGDSKIPSIICYDPSGTVRAVGAEATQEHIEEEIDDNGWVKLEWWKLHLRPRTMASSHVTDQDIPALPQNKTAVQVLADFMHYLHQCAKKYIEDSHSTGADMLRSVEHTTEFVLSHPNGWEGPQQMQIRNAAIMAGLVPDTPEGWSRIHLVTEGEASLHYCLGSGLTANGFQNDEGIIIVDAGGGTIDVSAYHMTAAPSFEEIAPAECRLQGSIFVSRRAKTMLRGSVLALSYNMVSHMAAIFDSTTKQRFGNENDPAYIKFGTIKDKDPSFNIRSGQLKLMGSDVATLFEPSAVAIIEAIEEQRHAATRTINTVFLVGGFAASEWLFLRLQDHLKPLGFDFCRPDSHTAKAVADGAVAFFLDHRVSARVAKFTYGTRCATQFDRNDPQHKLRASMAVPRPSGRTVLPNAFSTILAKGTAVSETKEFSKSFITEVVDRSACNMIATEIVCYRGDNPNPRWTDSEPSMFSTLCNVHADTSKVASSISPRRGYAGLQFYRQEFSIILMFGLTELQAQLSWKEDVSASRDLVPRCMVLMHLRRLGD